MVKRQRDEEVGRDGQPPSKRRCAGKRFNILTLSDELIIRVLSCLTVPELTLVER